MKTKIVYFGSSEYGVATIEALLKDGRYELVGVVSQSDKPVGRKQIVTPTPVSAWALEHGVELLRPTSWKKDLEALEKLKSLKADVGVLSYYGKILPQNVLDVFPHGIVNIHPSMLPKYRGATPGPGVILNGETKTGVSIMILVQEMDAGPVLAQEEFDVSLTEIPETYYKKGFEIGNRLLIDVLPKYLSGEVKGFEQDDSLATYSGPLSRDNGKIDWNKSAVEIERMVRAYTPWPGTWTEVFIDNEGKIHLEKEMAERLNLPFENKDWDGVHRKRMKILSAVLEGDQLVLDKVQMEGEKPVSFEKLIE
jgi:methionyl-tRNA formyltransferase